MVRSRNKEILWKSNRTSVQHARCIYVALKELEATKQRRMKAIAARITEFNIRTKARIEIYSMMNHLLVE